MREPAKETDTVVTQASFGGFDDTVTAKDLVRYLEVTVGSVWRCRLKKSWTPPESYPSFDAAGTSNLETADDYKRVEPHAFVHFALPKSAAWAKEASVHGDLFFNGRSVKVSLGPANPYKLNQSRRNTIPFKLPDVGVEIGTLVTRESFFVAWRFPSSGVDFIVDPFDGVCRFCFTRDTAFSFKSTTEQAVIKCDFKVEFSVRDIFEIKHYTEISGLVLLLQLSSAPWLCYRTADDDVVVTVPFDLLDDDDPWIRTTDFTTARAIGRCSSYRVSVPPRHGMKLMRVLNYLRERRVCEDSVRPPLKVENEPEFMSPLQDPFFCIHHKEGIPFEIMFLVNAAMHKGILNQHQLSDDFFQLLRKETVDVSVAALKHICSYRYPVFDAYKRLKVVQKWLLRNPKIFKDPKKSDDIVEMRRLAITPTKAYCLPPEVELSNRVLRGYNDIADRFLRVTFMDEGLQMINSSALNYYVAPIVKEITSNSFPQKTAIFKRVRSILTDGFHLCGRKYSFLAFSSNQLKDRSAWFFAENKNTRVPAILSWMGKFTSKNIAKCAARMGQCFSSTYATVQVPLAEVNLSLPDIERNGYVFSDGIGKITPELAKEVAEKLMLDTDPPCAYQIRYAGFKGVVACWPEEGDGFRLSLRNSMNKFQSKHTTLEICSWTRFQPGFLNRQIVTLLSTLNVPDEIFWNMQDRMISSLNRMLVDKDVAFDILTSSCAEQGNAAAMMLSAGFDPQSEPHLRGMLMCIRAAQLWGLREKARIFVPSGRWLMGCFDELGVLEYGQCFIQVSKPSLESCFTKHGARFKDTKRKLEVIQRTVIIAKNPCLHPGDVRILQAVDAPGLHHLYDCLVFPQKGDRPHPNEASGSDLDGDLYFVSWDDCLIPPGRQSWTPMHYVAAEAKQLNTQVSHQDIIEFFARNMVNESLGTICNAHVVHADRSDHGALDENCLVLAELAATAVDFPKTGKFVSMPPHMKPQLYPDFLGKEDFMSYKSTKILGRMYRHIKDVYDEDVIASSTNLRLDPDDIPYDFDLEVVGVQDYVSEAWNQKCYYDRHLSNLLAQYKVKREEEVVTGHIWSLPKYNNKKQGELKERLKHCYSELRKEFRAIFDYLGTGFEQLSEDETCVLYEKKAAAWYHVTYHPKWVKKALELHVQEGSDSIVLLSFAWIPADYLIRIKIKKLGHGNLDSSKPVNLLANYLAERF